MLYQVTCLMLLLIGAVSSNGVHSPHMAGLRGMMDGALLMASPHNARHLVVCDTQIKAIHFLDLSTKATFTSYSEVPLLASITNPIAGSTITVPGGEGKKYTVVAEIIGQTDPTTATATISKVLLKLGTATARSESKAPYSLFGDTSGSTITFTSGLSSCSKSTLELTPTINGASCSFTFYFQFQCTSTTAAATTAAATTAAATTAAATTAAATTAAATTPPATTIIPPVCTTPKLEGSWEDYKAYPLAVAESQGALLGSQLVQFSGFKNTFSELTRAVYALDLNNPKLGNWVMQADVPRTPGITHAAVAQDQVTMTAYLCGGYIQSSHVGTTECWMFSLSSSPQWTAMKPLPGGRGGGAMWLDKRSEKQYLIFTAGASKVNNIITDYDNTWTLELGNSNAVWEAKAPIPYKANHVGHTTVIVDGTYRHFVLGGQTSGNEKTGNLKQVYEYVPSSNTWIRHADMPFARGHFTESTVPYKGCGFFIVAGSINGSSSTFTRTADIHYYNISQRQWTKIGAYPRTQTTPVCEMYAGFLYCQTGRLSDSPAYSKRIKVT
jgi:hypothetical protein